MIEISMKKKFEKESEWPPGRFFSSEIFGDINIDMFGPEA